MSEKKCESIATMAQDLWSTDDENEEVDKDKAKKNDSESEDVVYPEQYCDPVEISKVEALMKQLRADNRKPRNDEIAAIVKKNVTIGEFRFDTGHGSSRLEEIQ